MPRWDSEGDEGTNSDIIGDGTRKGGRESGREGTIESMNVITFKLGLLYRIDDEYSL